MEKIDRLGWAAGISFVVHGARIGIRVNDPAVLERLPEHLPPGWRPSASPFVDVLYSLLVGGPGPQTHIRRFHLLYVGSARLTRTTALDDVFQSLETDLHLSVAWSARRRLFVQAGVVGWGGRALVILGYSASGTTTLVAELVRAGAAYYSDSYAVLDVQGRVHPHPLPLSLREEAGEPAKKCPVEALGGCAGTRPLPVGLMVVTAYQLGARWRPRMLTPGEALLALLDNTMLAPAQPELALPILQRVAAGAAALKSKRGEAQAVVNPLLEQLVAESTPIPLKNHVGVRPDGSVDSGSTHRPKSRRKEKVP